MESNYDILGIADAASEREVRDAFRRLALLHHSDRGGEGGQFIRIKQAYEDLKAGKKYPDTDSERLGRSRVHSGGDEEDVRRRNRIIGAELAREMALAGEWAAALGRSGSTGSRLFGSKALGELELERKAHGALSIKGNFMAGGLTYDGPVTMQGSVSSPTWADEFGTRIRVLRGDFRLLGATENKYRIENGAEVTVEDGNAVIGNVFGRKIRREDPGGRVGVSETVERRTRVRAPRGAIVAENAADTVDLEADRIIIVNAEDDVRMSAREVEFYGGKLTYDCRIGLRRGGRIRFHEGFSIQGLSGDAVIGLEDGRSIRLFDLKTKKIRDLGGLAPAGGHGRDDTMVGRGFAITYGMLEALARRPGRFGFGRAASRGGG